MKEFETIFRKEDSGRLIALDLLLADSFPEISDALTEIVREARAGVRLTLTALQHHHSHAQRGYYHMWKNAFAEFVGYTPDEMHEHILCEAYGSELHGTRLEPKRRPLRRSSDANRPEYSILIDTLIRVAAELDFHIPPPVKG